MRRWRRCGRGVPSCRRRGSIWPAWRGGRFGCLGCWWGGGGPVGGGGAAPLRPRAPRGEAGGGGGRGWVTDPMGATGGEPVWLVSTNWGGRGAIHYLGAEKVVFGSDLVHALTVEAPPRVRQPGLTRNAGELKVAMRWGS